MDADNLEGHFLHDQYLELLWKAQKIEDHRLAELILRRLKGMAMEIAVAPVSACEVIPFPGMPFRTNIQHPELEPVRLLWPRQPLRHLLSMVLGYCGLVLFFGFFGLNA